MFTSSLVDGCLDSFQFVVVINNIVINICEKFYVNMAETGNTVSSTVMIGLKECLDKGIVKYGDKVMISGFGVGLSWGGTILKF